MPERTVPWERYWAPREVEPHRSQGLLLDPNIEMFEGVRYNEAAVTFDEIADEPCLILLGEPGIGKTHSLERAVRDTLEAAEGTNDRVVQVDLGDYTTDATLVSSVFESTTVQEWSGGNGILHLFLDGLDEGSLAIRNIAKVLAKRLSGLDRSRLRLRITCRTAEWPPLLERRLRELWEKEEEVEERALAVYELQPLTEGNIRQAAEVCEVAADAFVEEVFSHEVTAFAAKPITLFFLLRIYAREGALPRSKTELYEKGCRLLCEEFSDGRRAAGEVGNLDADARLAVASRIAAVTLFCGRSAVWMNPNPADMPEGAVPLAELTGGVEIAAENEVTIDEASLREVLQGAALFESRGVDRLGFTHQTYAEFLAARHIAAREVSLPQVLSLITHAVDEQMSVIPQLQEGAAWLAALLPAVFRELMQRDPKVLLRSDIATIDESGRSDLVDALLRLLDEEKITDTDLHPGQYRKLKHVGLRDQLAPWITNETAGNILRRAAIDIAEACDVDDLQTELADIALDDTDEYHIRAQAAHAVEIIADTETRLRLKALLDLQPQEDPDNELRAYALSALWPDVLNAEELFAAIIPEARTGFTGRYFTFLCSDVLPHLELEDLPVALDWVGKQPASHDLGFAQEKLVNGIVAAAFEHMDDNTICDALASALLARIERHDRLQGVREPIQDENARRRLLESMARHAAHEETMAAHVSFALSGLASNDDVLWMLAKLEGSEPNVRTMWARILSFRLDPEDVEQVNSLVVAAQCVPELREQFEARLGSVELDSETARTARERYEESREIRNAKEPQLIEPLPKEQVLVLLERCESGDQDAWWRLNRVLTLKATGAELNAELEPDLTKLPGWAQAEDLTKGRILSAAETYLMEGQPNTERWLGQNVLHRPAFAGYRALVLLKRASIDVGTVIPKDIWAKWAPVIVAYPVASGLNGDAEATQQELVAVAYDHAPSVVLDSLMVLLDKENKEGGSIFSLRKVKLCWDRKMCEAVFKKAQDRDLRPECMEELLAELLIHNMSEAEVFTKSLVPVPVPTEDSARAKGLVAARTLVMNGEGAGWGTVWPAMRADNEFGKELFTSLAHGAWRRDAISVLAEHLDAKQLADLYIWLENQFPHDEDPEHNGIAHTVGPRESVAQLRDGIIQHLRARGTIEAVDDITRIMRELPELTWLKRLKMDAHSIMLRTTWTPLSPADLLEMAEDPRRRFVESGAQLLNLVIESLGRLQQHLQGHTPMAKFCWNDGAETGLRPKVEGDLSDFVKTHLERDIGERGVVVNREVEIRRPGRGIGERTDIHVDAIALDDRPRQFERITVVIEAKGCWSRELETAMETQLRDQYIQEGSCEHGLYLVGWFNCDKWDGDDYRKRDAPEITLEEAREHFAEQAAELSGSGVVLKSTVLDVRLS